MAQRSVRFPDELAERADVEAARLERSFSWLVVRALEAALSQDGHHAAAGPAVTGERREVDARGGTTDHPAPPRTPDKHHPDYTLPAPGPSKAELDMDRQARLNAAREKGKR